MQGHCRLGDLLLALDRVADRARGKLAAGEQFQDTAPHGIAQRVKCVHPRSISVAMYIRPGFSKQASSRA